MISGKVFSSNNEIIEFASVYVKNTTHGCSTNEKGVFHLKLRAGTHTIVFSALGFETQERIIEIKNGERIRLNISLKPHLMELEEVTVTAGGVSRINKSAFNAVAVDTKGVQNSTRDIAQVLDNISGVKIREEGGVGSSSQINLNGFTGKHVKIFMDGVPMEGAGSSFQINNIPANLAERIEVYKGVVPVDFGGDALGGAINIVTAKASNTYVDASYSYGSFNTHRTNVSFGYTGRRGFTFQLNAYQNYSDNDYKVKTQYTDVNTGAVSKDEQWFRRFHDKYHNEAVVAQIGVVNKSWADRMIFGVTYSREYAQIQNANLMKIVFGGKYRTTEGLTPSFSYDKKNLFVKNLDLSMTARYNEVLTNNVDTVAREYSWTGEYREKDTQGEGVATLAEFKGKTGYWVTNLNYRIGNRHFFSFNNMYSNYTRQTTNSAANASQSTAATFMRRKEEKNITGLSYKYVHSERWNLMAFTKYYYSHVCGPVNISSGTGRDIYEEQTRSIDATGYGLASAYNISKHWQAKLSYEKTYRLPTERELFGDGDYESGDAAIRPENSNNVNANLSYMVTCADDHSISFDLGMNYRYIQDYIIRTIGSKGVAVSANHGKVQGIGGDVSARYYYKNKFSIGGNVSYQDTRDKEKYNSIGAESVTYNNRVPNIPYLFSNGNASYTFHDIAGKGSSLMFDYSLQYVQKFFRSWSGEGAKLYIPQQLSHDAGATLSLCNGRYNISVEARNFTDAILYDNYSLQKPGRAFYAKFRYFFSKRN